MIQLQETKKLCLNDQCQLVLCTDHTCSRQMHMPLKVPCGTSMKHVALTLLGLGAASCALFLLLLGPTRAATAVASTSIESSRACMVLPFLFPVYTPSGSKTQGTLCKPSVSQKQTALQRSCMHPITTAGCMCRYDVLERIAWYVITPACTDVLPTQFWLTRSTWWFAHSSC